MAEAGVQIGQRLITEEKGQLGLSGICKHAGTGTEAAEAWASYTTQPLRDDPTHLGGMDSMDEGAMATRCKHRREVLTVIDLFRF